MYFWGMLTKKYRYYDRFKESANPKLFLIFLNLYNRPQNLMLRFWKFYFALLNFDDIPVAVPRLPFQLGWWGTD
jgi:hypothetical protein